MKRHLIALGIAGIMRAGCTDASSDQEPGPPLFLTVTEGRAGMDGWHRAESVKRR